MTEILLKKKRHIANHPSIHLFNSHLFRAWIVAYTLAKFTDDADEAVLKGRLSSAAR